MKTTQTKYGELTSLTFDEGLQLLKTGHTLTVPGNELNTLEMKRDGSITWMGRNDQAATVFEKDEYEAIKSLFTGYKWIIDL